LDAAFPVEVTAEKRKYWKKPGKHGKDVTIPCKHVIINRTEIGNFIVKGKTMEQHHHTPGRHFFISFSNNWDMGEGARFHDQEAFAASQLERALDLRNSGFPVSGLDVRERIKYYFLRTFFPIWAK
jgi:hypothetical protein